MCDLGPKPTAEIRFKVTSAWSKTALLQSTRSRERRLTLLQGHLETAPIDSRRVFASWRTFLRGKPYAISAEPRSVPNFVSGGMTRHICEGRTLGRGVRLAQMRVQEDRRWVFWETEGGSRF